VAGTVPIGRLSWLPAVALSVAFTIVVLFWDPHVRDLAASSPQSRSGTDGRFVSTFAPAAS